MLLHVLEGRVPKKSMQGYWCSLVFVLQLLHEPHSCSESELRTKTKFHDIYASISCLISHHLHRVNTDVDYV